jgi:hypothetical protein
MEQPPPTQEQLQAQKFLDETGGKVCPTTLKFVYKNIKFWGIGLFIINYNIIIMKIKSQKCVFGIFKVYDRNLQK